MYMCIFIECLRTNNNMIYLNLVALDYYWKIEPILTKTTATLTKHEATLTNTLIMYSKVYNQVECVVLEIFLKSDCFRYVE